MIFLPCPSYSSCAISSVLLADQPKREPQSFCSEGKSCSLGGPCRFSSTRTASAPSKPSAALTTSSAISRRTIRSRGACRIWNWPPLHLRCSDNFKIGEGYKIADFQLAFAHDCQRRRFHAPNSDHATRASAQDDGRSAG